MSAGSRSVTTVGPTEFEGPLLETNSCQVTPPGSPATTVWFAGVLAMARSASESKSVRSVLVLFAGFGSVVPVLTVAVFSNVPVAGASTPTAMSSRTARVWPRASPPVSVQVISWRSGTTGALVGSAEHVHVPLTSTFVPVQDRCSGSTSTTVTGATASAGPKLVTVNV